MNSSALLFLIFNRPNTTALVMEAIRAALPSRLYVAADGPRNRFGEAELCEAARRVATKVDWPCEVKTLFREENVGCGVAVSTAISWFFEHEEEGIILEDDCVPSHSFFRYCSELLDRYRHDERIMCISGDNYQQGRIVTPYSYYFSRYPHCWGWASWRRAWRLYDFGMNSWPDCRQLGVLDSWGDGDPNFSNYWMQIFGRVARGEIDAWAYQWLFSCWAQHGLTCLPAKNLVSNIGFGLDATHTTNADGGAYRVPAEELEFPLRHPPMIARNIGADRFTHIHCFDTRHNPGVLGRLVMVRAKRLRRAAATLLAQATGRQRKAL